MSQAAQVLEVITKKVDSYEKGGKLCKMARTTVYMDDGNVVCEFGEARTWQPAGNRSLHAALDAAGLSHDDVEGKVAFLI